MPDPALIDLVDVAQLKHLVVAYSKTTGGPVALLGTDNEPILEPESQEVCARFHRAHEGALRCCQRSLELIRHHLREGEPCVRRCENGLWTVGLPVHVRGRRLATVMVDQFNFADVPRDEALVRAQAIQFGFDPTAYLGALSRAPAFSRDQVFYVLDHICTLIGILAELGHKNRQLEKEAEDRRRMEAQILHAQKCESLGVLAGGLAHKFNNLLMAVIGNIDLALMELPATSSLRHSLTEAEKASWTAADLCKQMLAYSGKARFNLQPLDVGDLVLELTHLLEVSTSCTASIHYRLEPGLPSALADVAQVRQMIVNLVMNAVEAIGDKPGVITVSSGTLDCDRAYLRETWLGDQASEGPYVFIEIADTGCGMEQQTLERVFDPFFSTKFLGRGLGLPAVLGIVRGHRGAIQVQSAPGKGSTFRILLPAMQHLAPELTVGIKAEPVRSPQLHRC